MKVLFLLTIAVAFSGDLLYGQNTFELESGQIMLMTGKGPGQDGAINPYYGQDCYAIIKNIGKGALDIRIQQKGEIIKLFTIKPNTTEKLMLRKDHELYFEADIKEDVDVRLDFQKKDE